MVKHINLHNLLYNKCELLEEMIQNLTSQIKFIQCEEIEKISFAQEQWVILTQKIEALDEKIAPQLSDLTEIPNDIFKLQNLIKIKLERLNELNHLVMSQFRQKFDQIKKELGIIKEGKKVAEAYKKPFTRESLYIDKEL